jgi:GNAT superfamily N-acetyltransferase
MQKSFASIEVRPYEMQLALLNNPNYKILVSLDGNKNIQGFIAEWAFEEFIFLEHFAVQPELRGAGIGKTIMQSHLQNVEKPVIIEVESDETEISARRINFYKRLGFHLNDYGYYQPFMQRSPEDKIYLKIMSYPMPVNQESFPAIKRKIFREVYRIIID